MSINIGVHTKREEGFNVEAYITTNDVVTEPYPVIKIEYGSYGKDGVTIFPSFEQAKQLHHVLNKLMKEVAAHEKEQKQDVEVTV